MFVAQFTAAIPASFEAVGIDPETFEEVRGDIKIKINRLAFSTGTRDGFMDAMANADKDPRVIGNLLAGETDEETGVKSPGLLSWWEMYEDQEKSAMLPITCDNIISLPFDLVTGLTEAIFNKLFPQPLRVKTSPDGSAAAEISSSTTQTLPEDTPSLQLVASGE